MTRGSFEITCDWSETEADGRECACCHDRCYLRMATIVINGKVQSDWPVLCGPCFDLLDTED